MPDNLTFRSAKPTDLSAMLAIEQEQPFPWTEGMLRDCLQGGYKNEVLEKNNKIIGFAVMSLHGDEAEILNIAITSSERRHGYGRQLLQQLLKIALQHPVKKILLEVRASNLAAINLYQSTGFKIITTRKNYYPAKQGREDALILICEIK